MLKSFSKREAESFKAALPEIAIDVANEAYLEEPRGIWQGQTAYVVKPSSREEVADVLRFANAHGHAVQPYGGGTGLVGGQITPEGPTPIILSLEKMTRIRAVYPRENIMIAEAGAILADIQAAAEKVDRLFPLSLASEGSARIGGNLATNAGGVNVLRYGNTRDLCLGLEVVFADGQIWHGLRRLRKDNTGYDIRNLMIGSEGTLGIITAASLRLAPIPAEQGTALLSVASPDAALELLAITRAQVAEGVSAFELIHRAGVEFLASHGPEVKFPLEDLPEWMVLIDLGLGTGQNPQDALEQIFVAGAEAGLVSDGVIAQSETQRSEIWAVRENIPHANKRVGAISSHDISLPLDNLPRFIKDASAAIGDLGPYRINCFGHLGDGNLHFNIFPPEGEDKNAYREERPVVAKAVYDLVEAHEGSFSAEHGVGRLKVSDLEVYGDPVKLALMRQIKAAFDPNGILNPGAVLREV
jgi:FAD/FMN-containing dehydrogenase